MRVITRLEELQAYLPFGIDEELRASAKTFTVKITDYLLNLVNTGDQPDPILKQFIPDVREQIKHIDFTLDPFEERRYNPLPGVFHKYHQRVLLTVSAHCAVHCRFCFRRWMPIVTPDWPKTVAYLQQHPRVKEVVLSGGDPLMLSIHQLRTIMNYLMEVPQLCSVRIHSRLPVAYPAKSYDFPWSEYPSLRKVLVIHCNHPSELGMETARLCQYLTEQKVALFSQTVLLKGVNDRVKLLSALYEKLWAIGVHPYYLHLLDRVQGTAHFETSALRAKRLYALLQHYLPGYLVPKLVREEHTGKRYLSNYYDCNHSISCTGDGGCLG